MPKTSKKAQKKRQSIQLDCRFVRGAPEGTRTHTLKAREPKSRMSTNSITGAYLLLGDVGTEMERKNRHCGDST